MFYCEKCNKLSKSGEKANKLVIETRKKDYHTETKGVTHGSEIVKEITVCENCFKEEK